MISAEVAPAYPQPGLVERALDMLFPPMCVSCRKVGRWICAECWLHVAWSNGAGCSTCGIPSMHDPCRGCAGGISAVRTVVAVAPFAETVREAVHALKYEGKHAIATMMGRLMAGISRDFGADCVVPTPLHAARRRERGYDQAGLLARAMARELGLPCEITQLKRTRRTKQQASLGVEERRSNVAGAFTATRPIPGGTVLLVDDVYTTGATLNAAAAALVEGGVETVIGVVFGYADAGRDTPDGRFDRQTTRWSRPSRSTR